MAKLITYDKVKDVVFYSLVTGAMWAAASVVTRQVIEEPSVKNMYAAGATLFATLAVTLRLRRELRTLKRE